MIYVLAERDDESIVKIGFTATPNGRVSYKAARSRMSSIQVSTWRTLTCIATLPGSRHEEHRIHEEFDHYHLRGEWFLHHGDVKEWVNRWRIVPLLTGVSGECRAKTERQERKVATPAPAPEIRIIQIPSAPARVPRERTTKVKTFVWRGLERPL
jgi:hypothetical protein